MLNVPVKMFIFHYRQVYDGLVEDGTIVPKPDQAPPTVPMDFAWARVSLPLHNGP
jgi:hypothetical protein